MGNGSFIPSINLDSCIIEEQDDHLVVALRIPKATIAKNVPFLACLAESCSDDDRGVWSTRNDPPSRSNRWPAIGGFFRQMLRWKRASEIAAV
jgi:hypothetical protein